MTFAEHIAYAYKNAFAVFSGAVSRTTTDTAFITVERVWKGKLGTEVSLPTGVRDNGDGTITVISESFSFRSGEKYVIFARGTSPESMSTSVCEPNGKLSESKRTTDELDRIAKR